VWGHRGMSLRRARTQPSCVSKVPKKKPWENESPGRRALGLPLRVPPSSSRESHCSPKWFNVARQGRQNGTKFNSTACRLKNTVGVTATFLMGFPPHHRFPLQEPRSQVPPTGAPKPRCVPPSPGLHLWKDILRRTLKVLRVEGVS
jgi:hypothetical protein